MKTINGILLVAALAMTTACQIPLSGVKTDNRGVTLQFLIAGTGTSSSQSVSSARLLLPTVSSLAVTLTPRETSLPVQTKTVNILPGATQVSVAFGAVNVGTYTIQAQAYDGSGTLQFQQTGTLNLSPSQSSITLNLVPVFTSAANQLAAGQSVTGTLKAGTAQSWSVPATALISGGWNLQLTASPWVVLFAQDSDGAVFPPSATAGGLTKVQVTNGGASFITLYNPTPSDQGFQFSLNQTAQFTVYALDLTSNKIFVYSLNEATGAVAPLSSISLPTIPSIFIPAKFLLDPDRTRLYVTGTLSGMFSIDGYTIAPATGALTEIAGLPQSYSADLPTGSQVAITADQHLYWFNPSTYHFFSVPINDGTGSIALAGRADLGSLATASAFSLPYDSGYNLLVLPMQMTSLNLFQPTATGTISLAATPLSYGLVGGFPTFVNSYYHTLYAAQNSTSSSYNIGSPPAITGPVSTTLISIAHFAANPTSPNIYVNSGNLIADWPKIYSYTLSTVPGTYGQLTAGPVFTNGTNTIKALVIEGMGKWVVAVDNVSVDSNLIVLNAETMTQVGSSLFIPTTLMADLAVVRTQ